MDKKKTLKKNCVNLMHESMSKMRGMQIKKKKVQLNLNFRGMCLLLFKTIKKGTMGLNYNLVCVQKRQKKRKKRRQKEKSISISTHSMNNK